MAMGKRKSKKKYPADSILTYFHQERIVLLLITITGTIYNIGMLAGPYFEGQLVQYFYDLANGRKTLRDLLILAMVYIGVILFVQINRAVKRFYVRRFANNVSRSFKRNLYQTMVYSDTEKMSREDAGSLMTKAVSDADDCTEGMRKFTTEIFDTGLVMVAYLAMLAVYDWKLTILCMIFPPIAYLIAGLLRKLVTRTAAAARKATDNLNSTIIDRSVNALTYRSTGLEKRQREIAEEGMDAYEKATVKAEIAQNSTQPVYYAISMAGVIMIFLFGSRNVLHIGWTVWTIASFTTYLSCFTKLAKKASNSAKLFNAVQKAEVSWHRIKPFLKDQPEREKAKEAEAALLEVQNVSFGYVPEKQLFSNVSFQAEPGEIIGITGPIASGKSTFGRVFLQEYPYIGKILYAGENISLLRNTEIFAYAGHDPQLFTGTIRENICLGTENDQRLHEVIEEVCMQDEISSFANGLETVLGEAGSRLSGGQQARISLARALFSKAPVLILDDPFSAVDRHTEESIFNYLKMKESNRIIILISHRLHVFPQTDQVIWINEGSAHVSSHDSLLINLSAYKQLYVMQEGEDNA